jgi:hypothetical protein
MNQIVIEAEIVSAKVINRNGYLWGRSLSMFY